MTELAYKTAILKRRRRDQVWRRQGRKPGVRSNTHEEKRFNDEVGKLDKVEGVVRRISNCVALERFEMRELTL